MRRHSTKTLMGLTKRELVEYVRMAEHNQDVAEETLNQQAENVKDWIPVVRCKDCKWYKEGKYLAPNKFCYRLKDRDGEHIGYNYTDDDFCSYGERKDNGC